MKRLLMLTIAAAALAGCPTPKAQSCAQNAECPANSICVQGICQKGVPSGGANALGAGATRMTSGTLTMDATLGQPITPAGTAGTTKLTPAENTR
jgi:hypothetical protein